MTNDDHNNLPTKLSFIDWLESLLPFKLPRIPLLQVAKNFDKAAARLVASSLGNLSERLDTNTRRIKARSAAETALIERAEKLLSSDSDLGPTIQERAMHHALGEAIKTQVNREHILQLAAIELSSDKEDPAAKDAKSEIDSDWLNTFTKYAENKSNEDIQQIWAKILASEIRSPGSSSLRTLEFLASVNSRDAIRIVAAFTFVVNRAGIPKFIDDKNYVPYVDLLFLQEAGIITGSFGLGGPGIIMSSIDQNRYIHSLNYFSKIGIFSGPNSASKIEIPLYPLTEVGRDIFTISDTATPDYDFFEAFCKSLSVNELDEIAIADFVSRSERTIQYINKNVVFKKSVS